MLRLCKYEDIRDQLRTGDLVLFGGKGWISDAIKFVRRSPVSHVEVVLESKLLVEGEPAQGRMVLLIGSTTLRGKTGVQVNRMSTILEAYRGRVWVARLSAATRDRFDEQSFLDYMLHQNGKPYDVWQLLPFLLPFLPVPDDDKRLYCSELVARGFARSGILPRSFRAGKVAPDQLARFKLYDTTLCQLAGSRCDVPGFNEKELIQ